MDSPKKTKIKEVVLRLSTTRADNASPSQNFKMQKTNIEWTQYTFNPVVGCKHNCPYCYAKRMNDRFGWIPKWNEPKFFPERLNDKMPQKPSKIFVCSVADLFGDWIPKEWIGQVIQVAKNNPQHIFQFLTKNPKRYLEFEFPENCWLGTTIDYVNQARLNYLKQKIGNYKFISFEPLLGDMSILDLSGIDLVIVGADSSRGTNPPKKEWIESVKHRNLFYKKNIRKYL